MRLLRFSKHTLIGILLGLLLTPGLVTPPPVQAQWLTFDHPNFLLKVQDMAQQLDRWMKTVQHYTDMYDKAVKQVTSLGGILTTVDKQLARKSEQIDCAEEILIPFHFTEGQTSVSREQKRIFLLARFE